MASQYTQSVSTIGTKHPAPLTIRIAMPEDAASIQQIGRTVFALSFGHSLPAEDLNDYLEDAYSLQSVLDDIQSPSKTVCVACDSQKHVIGFATLTEGTIEDCIRSVPAPIELQRLYVDSTAHGKGIGSALIKHAEGIAKNRGLQTCWLGVWEENYIAQKVYEKSGYRKVGDHDFVMGKEVQTDWIMVKEL